MNQRNKEYKGEEIKNLVVPAFITKNHKEVETNYIPEQYVNYEQPCNYIPLIAPDEIFLPITVDDVLPNRYLISNYGRIFSMYNNSFMIPSFDDKGYQRLTLSTISGKKTKFMVHRLVMMTFFPIENPEQYEVNHRNGCTFCNWLSNLEWTTPLENKHHYYTELNPNEYICITKEKAYEVGSLIKDTSLSLKEISEMTGVSYANVRNISCGSSHKDVYDELELSKVTRMLTEESIHEMFRLYSEGLRAYQIADELHLCRKTVNDILYGGKKHLEIRNQYDLSNAYVPTTITDEDAHEIMGLYSKGYTVPQIQYHTGFNPKSISNIVHGYSHREIYEQYDLSKSTKRTMTDDLVRDIRRMRSEGMMLKDIKEATGVSIGTINDIVKGRTHTDVI